LSGRNLHGGVLIVAQYSGIAELHCSNVSPIELITQYLLQPKKPCKSTSIGLLRNRTFVQPRLVMTRRAWDGGDLPNA
jgi:hypothetical protein